MTTILKNTKNFFSKIGLNYLILGVVSLISQIILINIIYSINPLYLTDMNIISTITSLCTYIIPFPIFYLLMKKIKTTELEKTNINLKTTITYIGITLTLMLIGNIIGLIITNLLSGAIHTEIGNPIQQVINNTSILFNILIISIIAPIFEEILFRKLLIDKCIKYGVRTSILISAIIFAFFHGNLNQFFYAFFLGAFFAYVYIQSGKITYTIILHIIVNLMGSVASLIFSQSLINLQYYPNPIDLLISIGYISIIVTFLIIGIIGLFKYGKNLFKKIEQPLKAVLINIGMILFLLFFTLQIVYQILG